MDTLLTPPMPSSAEEASIFIEHILAQLRPLRAQMQAVDKESADLAAETQSLHSESAQLQARQRQAALDVEVALGKLASRVLRS